MKRERNPIHWTDGTPVDFTSTFRETDDDDDIMCTRLKYDSMAGAVWERVRCVVYEYFVCKRPRKIIKSLPNLTYYHE